MHVGLDISTKWDNFTHWIQIFISNQEGHVGVKQSVWFNSGVQDLPQSL